MNERAFAELGNYMDLLLDAICVVNANHEFTYLSAGAERVFGYKPEEMIGRSMFDYMHPEDRERTLEKALAINAGATLQHFTNRYVRKDGRTVHLLWSARWSEQDQMRVAVARDISEQLRQEQERQELIARLEAQALTDPLTQLPNRVLFCDRVRTAQARVTRDQRKLGVLYLDLDRFKQINDAHGHATGDQVLRAVAERLAGAVRATDTVARLGGDEFVVLVEGMHDSDNVRDIAEKIRAAMLEPLELPHGQETVTVSIGVAEWPLHGDTVEALLHHADQAMYRAKRAGGNRASP